MNPRPGDTVLLKGKSATVLSVRGTGHAPYLLCVGGGSMWAVREEFTFPATVHVPENEDTFDNGWNDDPRPSRPVPEWVDAREPVPPRLVQGRPARFLDFS